MQIDIYPVLSESVLAFSTKHDFALLGITALLLCDCGVTVNESEIYSLRNHVENYGALFC